MAYELRGVVGSADAVCSLGDTLGLTVVSLSQGFSLMPWTPDAFDALGRSARSSELAGLNLLHSSLVAALRTTSLIAPVAYVEAECFGGHCLQGSVLFEAGAVAWLSEFGPAASPGLGGRTPISEALARIGVAVTESELDEFDTVGLGRTRHTEDWLQPHSR